MTTEQISKSFPICHTVRPDNVKTILHQQNRSAMEGAFPLFRFEIRLFTFAFIFTEPLLVSAAANEKCHTEAQIQQSNEHKAGKVTHDQN